MNAIKLLLKQQKFSRNIVIFCLIWLCFYTLLSQALFYIFQIEMQFLTNMVFTVFGSELLLLMVKEVSDTTLKAVELITKKGEQING